jgi:hypothetical protein
MNGKPAAVYYISSNQGRQPGPGLGCGRLGAGIDASGRNGRFVNRTVRQESPRGWRGIAACRLWVLAWMDIPDARARLVSVLHCHELVVGRRALNQRAVLVAQRNRDLPIAGDL